MSIDGVLLGVVRELTPKDLYYVEVLKKEHKGEDIPQVVFFMELISRLSDFEMDEVMDIGVDKFRPLMVWFAKEILEGKVMTVYQWLEISFHLMKQRWDSSLDWLENQPMSKVLTMVDVLAKFNEKQNAEMKKSSRRK